MSDREFWLAIRAALLAMVAAIERKYLSEGKDTPITYDGDTITHTPPMVAK